MVAKLSDTFTIRFDPEDRELLERVATGLEQSKVLRERDRLRALAESAFALLDPRRAGVQLGIAGEVRDLLQNGLNATPIDSPDGTAGGQAYEAQQRRLQHQVAHEGDQISRCGATFVDLPGIAVNCPECRRIYSEATVAKLERRLCESNSRADYLMAEIKKLRLELDQVERERRDNKPHHFVATASDLDGDVYCDLCRNCAAHELHTRRP